MMIVFSHYSEGSWVTFQMFKVILFSIIFKKIFLLIRLFCKSISTNKVGSHHVDVVF